MESHKHLRRLDEIWVEAPIYFITTCTSNRTKLLATAEVAAILVDEWRTADPRHGWVVGRYVIMPDHVHFFCTPRPDAKTLSEFVRLWKQWTTKRIRSSVAALVKRGSVLSGTEPRLTSAATDAIWQREFFDHVLRSNESYEEKWSYVRQNPVRAGLVARADEWLFQGEIQALEFLSDR